jgi:hypothetical protein
MQGEVAALLAVIRILVLLGGAGRDHAVCPSWVDAVEKVPKCLLAIFSKETKLNLLADQYGTQAVSEVACEFFTRRRGPSHIYLRIAPAA